jgi:hypothetical protein
MITIYDPLTTSPNAAVPGASVRLPFPENKIPLNRQSALAQNVFALYPLANIPGDPVTGINNLYQRGSQPSDRYNMGWKVDYNINENQRIAGQHP